MPIRPLPTSSDALHLVQQHLPQVLSATGQHPTDWDQARLLSGIARQQLRRHYFTGDVPAPPEAETVLLNLSKVDVRLHLPATGRNWLFAQQQLGRIMPLVERLLAA